jgi:hypothetical protein
MKKKSLYIVLSLTIPMLAIIGLICCFNSTASTSGKGDQTTASPSIVLSQTCDVDWADHFDSLQSMIKGTNIVIKGKVVASYTEQRVDMIFTKQVIQVTKVYGGAIKVGDRIELLQTGGTMNGASTTPFKEAPLLNKSDEYLLFLEHTSEGHYLIVGGYQGRADIQNRKVVFSPYNNEISKEFLKADSSVANSSAGSLTINLTDVEAALAQQGLNIKN